MDDYLLKIKVQNNKIVSLMYGMGIKSVSELSRQSKIGLGLLHGLINMTDTPLCLKYNDSKYTDRPWRACVIKLADFFGVLPDEMFNEQQMFMSLQNNHTERTITTRDINALLPGYVPPLSLEDKVAHDEGIKILNETLEELTPKEQKILKMRFGLDGHEEMYLEEAANAVGVTRERVRQIQMQALRHIRAKAKKKLMSAFDIKDNWDGWGSTYNEELPEKLITHAKTFDEMQQDKAGQKHLILKSKTQPQKMADEEKQEQIELDNHYKDRYWQIRDCVKEYLKSTGFHINSIYCIEPDTFLKWHINLTYKGITKNVLLNFRNSKRCHDGATTELLTEILKTDHVMSYR